MNYNTFLLVLPWLISNCLCEITENTKVKLLTDFINYYNLQPNHDHLASDEYLQSVREIDFTTFRIEVSFGFNKNDKRARMKCSATVKDIGEKGIALVNNDMYCAEVQLIPNAEDVSVESVEDQARKPVKLENEVQSDTALTSGEQFIAIPRDQPSAPCIGCSSHVNPQAAGVKDLANLGIRHLNLHEPTVKHSLESVIDVERQVQVVNGVRYNLILSIYFNNCSEVNTGTDVCSSTKTCKISILVKPWQTLPSGSKYRSILANNCTEEWLFGDNGEVLPELTDNSDHKERDDNTSSDVDDIKVERHEDSQSQPNQERTLTIEEIKALEEQILPHDSAHHYSNGNKNIENISPGSAEISKEHVVKAETNQQFTNNNVDVTDSSKKETADISQDKKKVIDEMLDFLNFSGFKARPQQPTEEMIPRVKRSYDYDLQILKITEKFRDLKKSIENAKYIYEMAQAMVDYLNEIDMAIKNRAVKNVLKAEEEEENDKRFVYIQAQIVIPCDTVNCEAKKTQTKICNGVIDSTNKNNPQILNTFCHVDTKEMEIQENVKEVSSDDPVLLRLSKEVLRKIESESTDSHAIKIMKIVAANTRVVSGRVTKISMVIEHINCNKSVPMALRTNCSTLQNLGSNICEVIVHEKHWLKEKKISYTCTERPIDMTISKHKQDDKSDDPKIVELLEEALHYLEVESDKKYKQKIVKVSNITTQIIAGFLINIEFVVGYTNCTHAEDFKAKSGKCELLTTERLRRCKAQVWDRLWIVDGRQMEVTCDENTKKRNELDITRKKRSLDFVGGDTVQNVDNPEYQKLAEESLHYYLKTSSSQQYYEIIKIERVTVQVVSGKKTKIKFIISPTDCNITSDGSASLSLCKLVNTDTMINCNSTILEQPWINNKQYSVQCDMDSNGSRPKSEIGGLKNQIYAGIKNQDQRDPKFQILAEESLQKYIQISGGYQPFKVIKIENVTTQIVQGLLTRIEFIATDGRETQITCYSKVWEQEWLNKKDIDVSCQNDNQKVKRQLVGGPAEADPNNPKYVQLANESLQKYLSSTGNANNHEVVRVNKASTQVVSGSLTKIDFDVKETSKSNDDTLNCHSEIWERPWLDKKDITVSCQSGIQRVKRQLVGGVTEADPNNPKYVQLANESLQKYLSSTGNANNHEVVRINKASTQVVSGSLTKIDFDVKETGKSNDDNLNCHSEIWERPWLDKKDITVSCQSGIQRVKRQLVGGPAEADPKNPKYVQLANESLQKYLFSTGNAKKHEVVRINKVSTQVVSGSLTKIDFDVKETGKSNDDSLNCHSVIWERPWLDKKDITVSCQSGNQRVKRQLVGGLTEADPNNPKYVQLAKESLQKYLLSTGNARNHELVRINKVSTQVVSGSLTKIDFDVKETGKSNDDTLNCHSEIWERPWLDKKDITVSCQSGNQKEERQLIGAPIKQDPTDLKYIQLAGDSLQKYLTLTSNPRPHKVVRIKSVTTQLVSGLLTRIDFVATESDISSGEIITCFSKIWEQEWQNKKDIDVSCQSTHRKYKRYDLSEKNPNDPKYLQLADESLKQYLSNTGNEQPHKVVRVKKVNVQLISGLLTRLSFVALPTDTTRSDVMNCYSEVLEQPWHDKKDIKVSCQYDNHGMKKEISGKIIKRDPNAAKYLKLAEESFKKYLSDTGNQQPYKVVRIDQVTTQISVDYLTRINFVVTSNSTNAIMNCFSEIWEQADKTKLNVECENDLGSRQKRDLKQGKIKKKIYEAEQDVTKPQFQLLAAQALRKYSQRNGILHKIVGVKRVTKRVVSGIIYKIDFSASPTECLFNVSNVREHSCKLIANTTLYCHTEIWDQPWIRKKKIDIGCNNAVENDYDDYTGDESEETGNRKNRTTESERATNEKVFALAEEALEDFLSSSNRKYVFRITEIHSFDEYMADSVINKLEFSIAPTLCLRDAFIDISHSCEFKKPLTEYYCKAKIVEQSWLESEKDIKIHCKKQNNKTKSVKRSKRQIGRNVEEDDNEVDEETAHYYAERAVHQLNERSDTYNLYKLITIHAVRSTTQMKAIVVKMFIEVAETYCLRQNRNFNTMQCEEMEGLNHRICLAKIYPSTDDELVVRHVTITCDDDDNQFDSVSGLYIPELLRLSITELEKDPQRPFKLVHQGEPQVIPSLDTRTPVILNFIIAITNCSVNVDLTTNPFQCYIDTTIPSKSCTSKIWLDVESSTISNIEAECNPDGRKKRAILDTVNITADDSELNKFMKATIDKLEMSSIHRYKQRVLHINSYSSRITSGRVTTIDFDVAYTSCLKYEWVANITSCDFLEHLPRRHCVAQIWERLWINNGMNIDVSCEDDETPLEAHVEFESAEMANQLAQESLKHIEAKYPNPKKQKVVRIFSLEKQVVAGVHYRMKMEVGTTDCVALSDQTDCKLNTVTVNKFCRVNVWVRPWIDHPPNFRVTCDYQEGATLDLYSQLQAEHLFINFLATYNPSYVNDHHEMEKRFEIFKENVRKIHEFNVYERGTAKYGVTRFADLTYKEFSSRYMGLKQSLRKNNQSLIQKANIPSIKMPLSFDWREYNAVTDVKDQGDCGVSWAFSVTGNIESQWKIKSEKLLTLSEQQLLDCDKVNEGCSGGLPEIAYREIEEMGGMQSDLEYSYEGGGETCLFNKTRTKVRISGAVNITSNETGMAQWLLYNGPISIGMNGQALQFYMGGIAQPWQSFCDKNKLDHAALIVGYGEHEYPVFHKKIRYWIVKNSWGETWGEKGYYRIQRGSGTCGVNRMATSAVIAN